MKVKAPVSFILPGLFLYWPGQATYMLIIVPQATASRHFYFEQPPGYQQQQLY